LHADKDNRVTLDMHTLLSEVISEGANSLLTDISHTPSYGQGNAISRCVSPEQQGKITRQKSRSRKRCLRLNPIKVSALANVCLTRTKLVKYD